MCIRDRGDSGLYEVAPLGVGVYSLRISKAGFKPVTVTGVDLRYGETRTVDAKLEVGATSDAVAVTATAESVSYTHLDVYKRQLIRGPIVRQRSSRGHVPAEECA